MENRKYILRKMFCEIAFSNLKYFFCQDINNEREIIILYQMVTNRSSQIIQYEFVTYLLNHSQILQTYMKFKPQIMLQYKPSKQRKKLYDIATINISFKFHFSYIFGVMNFV